MALVTGASRGIGLAVAQRLRAEGAQVVITARKPEGLEQALAELGGGADVRAVAGRADDPEHQQDAIDTAVREFGGLDVLVNNTGINPAYGKLVDLGEDAARKIMDVNVLAALAWTRRALAAGLGARAAGCGRQHGLGGRAEPGAGHRLLRREQGGADQPDDPAGRRAGAGACG